MIGFHRLGRRARCTAARVGSASGRSACARSTRLMTAPVVLLSLLALPLLSSSSGLQAQSGALRPGPTNSLADVGGLSVGHFERTDSGYLSGTTVVLARGGAVAGVDVRGGAPGTRETDLLEPGGLVTEAHAIVLSGGSAFGLDTAAGVMQWLEQQGIGYRVPGGVVPIVPTAILYDLGRGGDFARRPDADFGRRAAEAAAVADGHARVPQGRVGAGTGARFGLGSASAVLPDGTVVAALVALNSAGLPLNPADCRPWALYLELDDEFDLGVPSVDECRHADWSPPQIAATATSGAWPTAAPDAPPFNTTIAVVATDAPLDQTQVRRMAQVANSGLARAIRPVHNLADGDAVFGLATGLHIEHEAPDAQAAAPKVDVVRLQQLYEAAADALGRAVIHALIEGGSYCRELPGACSSRPGS